ncbi:MAG: MBL fold metallo-hydrolase [Ruminococcaceae bacterium]|nr:MBL fold metallo-hydrolase [Oscillospiraceae bacterium]
MKNLAEVVRNTIVPEGNVAVFWTGQAGFIFKTDDQKLIGLDLYLSDACQRLVGFKRLSPALLSPEELAFEIIAVSHAHPDHFDADALPQLVNEKTQFIGALDTEAECEKAGLTKNLHFVKPGETLSFGGVKISAVPCDHGELAPDAVGFLLDFGGKRVYYAGDTAFRYDLFANEAVQNIDLLLVPINGMYGNMNGEEGARAAEMTKAQLTVPYHFWCFAEHCGNPLEFMNAMKEKNLPHTMLYMGEGILL